MKKQNVLEKGEIGQDGEKWDKTRGELGQMRLSVFAERTAPDSVMSVPDVPQQDQTGPDSVASV